MYRHYCKDPNCQGHTKSWERCCDIRAFAAPGADVTKRLWSGKRFESSSTPATPMKKLIFA